MSFVTRTQVRFAHVDAAGIVFYPRYFEMVNAAVEDFFAQVVGVDFARLHLERGLGVPTVKLESEFRLPSRLGDDLDFAIDVESLGTTSATLNFAVRCGGEMRVQVRSVLVCMELATGRPQPWPADIRAMLAPALAA